MDYTLAFRRPKRRWWPVYLFFRPRKYFLRYAVNPSPVRTVFCILSVGLIFAFARFNTVKSQADTYGYLYTFIGNDTAMYGFYLFCFSFFIGFFDYLLFGWWFKLRLRFCGATVFDPLLPRRIYIHSCLIPAIPLLMLILVNLMTWKWDTSDYEDWVIVGGFFAFLFLYYYSIYVSYRGVRTCFPVEKRPARVWFLILPVFNTFFWFIVLCVIASNA